jgi:hypothetical protein
MQAPSESTTVDFSCSLTAKTVHVTLDYTLNVSRAGKRMGRRLSHVDCSNKDNCPIATRDGTGTTYDWSSCVYVHAPKVEG